MGRGRRHIATRFAPALRENALACLAGLAAAALATAGPASAQAPVPGLERRATPGLGAPALRRPAPAPGFVLPPLPELPPPLTGPPVGQAILVREIRLEGNTALSDATLAPILRRYEGRRLTMEELLRLRDELTLAYVERGYVNSGAVLPDQDVVDGVVTLRLIEGALREVRFEGLHSLDPAFLEARIRQGAGTPPLDIAAL
jgi:hemolysin activation/secretion protein